MDFDIVDDSRPRLQLQSGPGGGSFTEEWAVNKVHAGICVSVGVVLLGFGWSWVGPLQFLAVWLGLSLIVGPFAPPLVTGGDCRVGVGELIMPEEVSKNSSEQGGSRNNFSRERHAPRRSEVSRAEVANGPGGLRIAESEQQNERSSIRPSPQERISEAEDKGWSAEEVELLKKLVVKHPRGTLRRWEVISEALGVKHNVDDVVKMAKSLGQKKTGDQDSYSRFLALRKGEGIAIASPLSQRDSGDQQNGKAPGHDKYAMSGETPVLVESDEGGKGRWTDIEDKALLTALKTFPKDSPMRWDKVALAIPGRSKAQSFRRFSDLRKNFRNATGGGSSHGQPVIE